MDRETIERLNALNRNFYATIADEFDATRGRAWDGWARLSPYLTAPLSVLDVGCGNGRFGVFLADTLTGAIDYHGLDNAPRLLEHARNALTHYPALTVTLTEHDAILNPPDTGTYDLVVLFGVLHHVPGAENRQQFIRQLAQRVASGGLLVFASWQFYDDERLKRRIVAWPDDWHVEPNDFLLDWRRGERALRYCHHVDETEQAQLIEVSGLTPVTTYFADGASGRLNRYVVLKRA